MTLDQFLHLLAVLVWPFVAIVAGMSFVRGCVLLVDCVDRCRADWRQVTTYAAEIERAHERIRYPIRYPSSNIRETCERALLAILQANGGFPGSRDDHVTRQMVREIREMYAELESPTKAPPAPPKSSAAADEFYDDEGTDQFGYDRPAHVIVDDADELDELDELDEELG